MYINIEIKAKCFHPEKVEAFLLESGAKYKGIDHQRDVYFKVPSGRLKLRRGNIENSLIFYERPDQQGPKQSDFSLASVQEGDDMEQTLSRALGVKVIVEKFRKIFFIGNIKFHIDEVPGLGCFVEIEAGNKSDASKTITDLQAQCAYYMAAFDIQPEDLLQNSYSDMLLQ